MLDLRAAGAVLVAAGGSWMLRNWRDSTSMSGSSSSEQRHLTSRCGVPRYSLAPGLEISRMLVGLWQVADLEREGGAGLDQEAALTALQAHRDAGLDCFDMADHYGSAECLMSKLSGVTAFTKWVPTPGPHHATAEAVDAAVQTSLQRMGSASLALLQLHTWDYLDGPGSWLTQLRLLEQHPQVDNVALCNFDTAHARIAIASGVKVVANQVSFSLLDRRAGGAMSALCSESQMRLLAFGVLAGGLLTDRYLDRGDLSEKELAASWSLSKYRRYIECCGGWPLLQQLLKVLRTVADRHVVNGVQVSIANVATRWVLEQPMVASAIVGVRLGHAQHIDDNKRAFMFVLSNEDHAQIDGALQQLKPLPGDCGDEYRQEPYLTASGDLSHHLSAIPNAFKATELPGHTEAFPRLAVDSGTCWESIAGFSRAVRTGNRVCVSGTTATDANGNVVGGSDPAAQATFAIDLVEASLKAVGAKLTDTIRTRIFVKRLSDWEAVARVHGQRFDARRPANTLVQAALVGDEYLVEVECEAEVA